ncbi:MAG TPA: efflux RND transporter periplasmic adaptor subunit [Pseudolabrys sp.]|nr:efflux RND transporter periplasmic adaptor subunit [Pseudolabrys sp.]
MVFSWERLRQSPQAGVAALREQKLSPASKPAEKLTEEKQGNLALTIEQIAAAGIEVQAAGEGILARRIIVPGSIVPNADRIARVSVKLSGTIAELRKKPGDLVAKDEVLAVLESREVADAKSEYLAARLTNELQQELFERDKALWEKNVSNEQQFLRSRNAAAHARMRLDIARQKLLALGLGEDAIVALPNEPEASLRRQDVHSPISGRVVERKVDLGTAVGRDNLETELFVVIDLATVWVELAVNPADLPIIREGQHVTINARSVATSAEGKIIFISPLLDKETRSARVVAQIPNNNGAWMPGSFVTAAIAVETQPVRLAVPAAAVQTVSGEQVVFVRTPDGFEKRSVTIGRRDARLAEVTTGLRPGEMVAVTNTFVLKAEASKAIAED